MHDLATNEPLFVLHQRISASESSTTLVLIVNMKRNSKITCAVMLRETKFMGIILTLAGNHPCHLTTAAVCTAS